MKIFNKILSKVKENKSKPWTKDKLITVLKHLKKGKARDPHGLINDIFKPDIAGSNLIDGLLLFLIMKLEDNKKSLILWN